MTHRTSLFCCVILSALSAALAGCREDTPAVTDNRLTIEEHALAGEPATDPLTFVPLQGSQEEILKRHAGQRSDFTSPSLDEGIMGFTAELDGEPLLAAESCEDQDHCCTILTSDGEEIYNIDTGVVSPINALRGLWTYDGNWVLEAARVSETVEVEDGMTSIHNSVIGQIVVNGELLDQSRGYEEAFGFQIIQDRPFYFYKSNGQIGFSYDGQETNLGYEMIPHYGCCSAGELNPVTARNMVAFFTRKGDIWYYVEIGMFDP